MKTRIRLLTVCAAVLVLCSATPAHAELPSDRQLIADHAFRHGFILWDPKPGQHIPAGELPGLAAAHKPAWGLSQWSSKFPLTAGHLLKLPGGSLSCSNAAKAVVLGAAGTIEADLIMAANSIVEYGGRIRQPNEPWVHLLVEQEFDPPAPLLGATAAHLRVETRLLHSRSGHTAENYLPGVHAAQFQLFFTVQNRNRQSAGFGDFLWFGVPLYDNRNRFPKEFKAQDFGGTSKFIYTLSGHTYASESAHDGTWISVDKDLLPLMRDALNAAWARGFLPGSKSPADYYLGGMNMGWELPGSFDVAMQIRNLSLRITR